ncbi:hypothetical protein OUZ56_033628 [Daphnia magna]|uniref:Uncharacterized protein n=1 Tax=Daphnia magna TaxID=35525 RepID=A0ABQ9ZY35_9CRUS|nr:hypothetical protein OUZ56_033628 [Daphnia magna]
MYYTFNNLIAEQPATHYLLNRTVGSWLHSFLQLPSNHQLMFLTAPLTAFKHDSEAAGCVPFCSPKATTDSFRNQTSHQFFAFHSSVACGSPSFTDCTFFGTHQTTTNFQTDSYCNHQFIVSNSSIVYGPTSFTDCSFFGHPSDSQQCIVFLTALLPAVHHPSQTALFLAPIRQQPIFKRTVGCVPFCSPKATTNSLFLIAPLSTVQHPLQAGLFRIHLTATNCNEPIQATSSLLFKALLPAVHHPSQTTLFLHP